MEACDERAELAPRDVVARAIDAEMKKSGSPHLWLDISHQPRAFLKERFPSIFQTCLGEGLDISKDWIPVVPAAHYPVWRGGYQPSGGNIPGRIICLW